MEPGGHRKAAVEARLVSKTYRRGVEFVHALREVSLQIWPGEFTAIVGPSGAGKTTLLNLMGCLDVPTSGTLRIGGHDTAGLAERQLTRLRRDQVGFVFQHFGLIPTLTVEENVGLPSVFRGGGSRARVEDLLRRVGLYERRSHRPHELSGGEMQRTAIARALVNEPTILLADEPTGNLDTVSGAAIVELFRDLQKDGLTVVVVTHNLALAASADRQVELRDGAVASDSRD